MTPIARCSRVVAARRSANSQFGIRSWPKVVSVKKKVETVFLVCDETGDHNYTIRRKTGGEKLKLSKYSPKLRKHTMHTEKKK